MCESNRRASSTVSTAGSRFGFGMADFAEPRQLDPKHVLVQEQQCGKRLMVCRRRNCAFARQMRQESDDVLPTHFSWMALAVKEHVLANPMNVRALGANAVVLVTNALANLIQKARRFVARGC
jgi:hypothetical protein